ncbi:hypothetical protein BJY04DRAFT_99170 [Aspergillus karnatakaensis]|uniref:uncharacterized protein n=1 Tax=Aspergillus karnatakaensis TaxID=1810916 RepID=UPI003CCDFF7F
MSMSYEECLSTRTPRPTPNVAHSVMDQFKMNGKVCVVTGGSRGIGQAIAEALAEAGAHIIIVHQTPDPTLEEKAAALATRCGVTVVKRRCNVADPVAVQSLTSAIRAEFGRLDVFVANAGVSIPKPILEQTLEEYHTQMAVNVHGVFYCAKYVGAIFKEQGFGNFIITGSISGRVVTVPVDHITYNTSKAAVTHLGRSLAREWRDFARVNIVAPGYIETAMSNCEASNSEAIRMATMGRLGDVRELKAIYLYLASDASSFVTGAEFTVDGGYTLP